MVTKVGMYSATYESVTMPVGRDRKIRTALRSNQIIGFVTVPSEKKIIDICMHAGSSEFASLFSLAHFLHKTIYKTHNSPICSDRRLTLKTSI